MECSRPSNATCTEFECGQQCLLNAGANVDEWCQCQGSDCQIGC
jgi:hypothetical protein